MNKRNIDFNIRQEQKQTRTKIVEKKKTKAKKKKTTKIPKQKQKNKYTKSNAVLEMFEMKGGEVAERSKALHL